MVLWFRRLRVALKGAGFPGCDHLSRKHEAAEFSAAFSLGI